MQGLKTISMFTGTQIERIVNLQGLKTRPPTYPVTNPIERIVNLPTHIGGLTLFSKNKDKNKSRKFQSTKVNKVIELLKNRN